MPILDGLKSRADRRGLKKRNRREGERQNWRKGKKVELTMQRGEELEKERNSAKDRAENTKKEKQPDGLTLVGVEGQKRDGDGKGVMFGGEKEYS